MWSGVRICSSAASSASGNELAAALRCVPARGDERAREHRRRGQRAERDRLVHAAPHRDAQPQPDRREREAGDHEGRGDEHDIEPHEAVLELGHHRRRRVAGGTLPQTALHRGDEVDDPRADGDAQRQDRRRRRMFGDRGRRRRDRDGEAGIQQMAEHDRRQLRRVDAAAVAFPEQDRGERRQQRDDPAGEQHDRLRGDAREGRHRMLHLDLQRAALPIARHQADRRRTAAGTPPRPRRR